MLKCLAFRGSHDALITLAASSKDLGVIVNNGLTFHTHINGIVAKAHARANLIFSFVDGLALRTPALLLRLSKHMFGPYWNIVHIFSRNNYLRTSNRQIESVQR